MQATKSLSLLFFVFLSAIASGKGIFPTRQQVGMFANTTTCVVLEGNNLMFDGHIRKAMADNWAITPFEFIDRATFEQRRLSAKYSFIVLTSTTFENDKNGVQYDFINLLLGDTTKDIGRMPELCAVPLSYTGNFVADYGYALPTILRFMQQHVRKTDYDYPLVSLNKYRYYNRNTRNLSDKTLLINTDDANTAELTPDKVKPLYAWAYELVDPATFKDRVAKGQDVFLYMVAPGEDQEAGRCFKYIIGADGEGYYYEVPLINAKNKCTWGLADFKKMK